MKTTVIVTVLGGVVQDIECLEGGDIRVIVRDYDVDQGTDLTQISDPFCISEGIEIKKDDHGDLYEESIYQFDKKVVDK